MINHYVVFVSFVASCFISLCGVVWRQQNSRLNKIELKLSSLSPLYSDIAEIKADIRWIKESLK